MESPDLPALFPDGDFTPEDASTFRNICRAPQFCQELRAVAQ
jgi:hypothetical protein